MMLQTMTPDMLGTASAATVNKCVVCCLLESCGYGVMPRINALWVVQGLYEHPHVG